MECKYCDSKMEFIYCDDTGCGDSVHSLAYNVYVCSNSDCFSLCREDVWDYKGVRWIAPQHKENDV